MPRTGGDRRCIHHPAGFTLVELLVVIGIIAVLAAIIFPVFAQARGKARQTTCVSNLRQIGMGMGMYAEDYDDLFPRGGDPVDKNTDLWGSGAYADQIASMPLLSDVLNPYIKSRELWRCPADTGFDFVEDFGEGQGAALPARPTSYEKYGMSYCYRTELVLRNKLWGTTGGSSFSAANTKVEHGPAELCILFDAHGDWHGTRGQKRYDVLMGDGHAKNLSREAYQFGWELSLSD